MVKVLFDDVKDGLVKKDVLELDRKIVFDINLQA